LPFGDQRDRLRATAIGDALASSPRSVAIVKISPCVEIAARLVVGEG